MTDMEVILNRLLSLISNYSKEIKIEPDMDLMAKPISFYAHEMAALFLDIERDFGVDLNDVVPDLVLFSPKEISKKISYLKSLVPQ